MYCVIAVSFCLFALFLSAELVLAEVVAKVYNAESPTLVFQLRAWQKPPVNYDNYYSAKGKELHGEPLCQVIGPQVGSAVGTVISFEGMRRAVAETAGIPLNWVYVFPTDDFIAKFTLSPSEGWVPGPANTTLVGTNQTTAAPATLAPGTRGFMGGAPPGILPSTQIFAVWLMIRAYNSTTPLSDADVLASQRSLLSIATNTGRSHVLAAAAGPAFFGLQAMDFGTIISTAPMRAQKNAQRDHWLAVYNDEWDRFLVGMLATTILGTAVYITAHFWIHKVKTHGALSTAEVPTAEANETKDAQKAQPPGARAAAAAATSGLSSRDGIFTHSSLVPPAAVPVGSINR